MAAPAPSPPVELVASKQHTAILLLILAVLALAAVLMPRLFPAAGLERTGRLSIYAQILVVQAVLFWYARAGIRRAGGTSRRLIDESPLSLLRLAVHFGIALAAIVLWMFLGFALGMVLRPSLEELGKLQFLFPKTAMEKLGWAAVSLTTGFTEEFLYRGYLLKQFRALTRSLAAALFLQAAVYALAHAALPFKIMVSVCVLGLFLGALAAWRKSLVPAMLMHAGISLLGGFLASMSAQ